MHCKAGYRLTLASLDTGYPAVLHPRADSRGKHAVLPRAWPSSPPRPMGREQGHHRCVLCSALAVWGSSIIALQLNFLLSSPVLVAEAVS